jgi:uncharacterized membrane protein YhaH (DUF805 family)
MGIFGCYVDVLKNKYADLDGRAGRREFWFFTLMHLIVFALLGFMAYHTEDIFFVHIYFYATYLPLILVGVRRLHDIGKSGWWLFLGLIPILGQLYLLYLFCQPSDPGENQYRACANLPENHAREVLKWFVDVLRNRYAKFSGRARRKEYWLFYVAEYLGLALLTFVTHYAAQLLLWLIYGLDTNEVRIHFLTANSAINIDSAIPAGAVFLYFLPAFIAAIYILSLIIPVIAIAVRRLHDIGKSGWWLFLALIPGLGVLYLTYLQCQDSAPGENKYGPNPKENQVDLT